MKNIILVTSKRSFNWFYSIRFFIKRIKSHIISICNYFSGTIKNLIIIKSLKYIKKFIFNHFKTIKIL